MGLCSWRRQGRRATLGDPMTSVAEVVQAVEAGCRSRDEVANALGGFRSEVNEAVARALGRGLIDHGPGGVLVLPTSTRRDQAKTSPSGAELIERIVRRMGTRRYGLHPQLLAYQWGVTPREVQEAIRGAVERGLIVRIGHGLYRRCA